VISTGHDLVIAGLRVVMRGTGAVLVERLDFTIPPATVTTLMGPSGSGKSTVLAYLAGFLDRSAFVAGGSIEIGGERLEALPPEKRGMGLLFQEPLLFPHLSVAGNLLYGVPRGQPDRRGRVEEALARAGLDGFADRDPATLSGGQRARIALLRTLLAEPRALLLDEPFGKLDANLRDDFRRFVFDHARERALPTLLVTHDSQDADAAGGPIVRL
jgi:putative thiamine transport system ATP-binding protein